MYHLSFWFCVFVFVYSEAAAAATIKLVSGIFEKSLFQKNFQVSLSRNLFFLLTSWARFSDFQGQVTPATKKTIFLHQHQLQPQSRNSLESRRKEEEAGLQKLVRQRPKMLKNCCLCRIMFYLEPSDCNYRWAQKFFLRTLRSKISLLVTNLWKIESNLKWISNCLKFMSFLGPSIKKCNRWCPSAFFALCNQLKKPLIFNWFSF